MPAGCSSGRRTVRLRQDHPGFGLSGRRVRRGEPGVIVAFEQTPSQSRTRTIGDLVQAGRHRSHQYPFPRSVHGRGHTASLRPHSQHESDPCRDRFALRFRARRGPTFREDFRESLFRMIAALSNLRVTVLMTSELEDRYSDLRFSPYGSAFLTDAIIVLHRGRELPAASHGGRQVRASAHSNDGV